jgi:hypothetical protein
MRCSAQLPVRLLRSSYVHALAAALSAIAPAALAQTGIGAPAAADDVNQSGRDCRNRSEAGQSINEVGLSITALTGEALLRAAVAESLERGVFGSPYFIAAGEPFFGFDKLGLVEEWLASGGW